MVITFKKKECEAVVKLVSQSQVPGMCLLNYSFIYIFICVYIYIYIYILIYIYIYIYLYLFIYLCIYLFNQYFLIPLVLVLHDFMRVKKEHGEPAEVYLLTCEPPAQLVFGLLLYISLHGKMIHTIYHELLWYTI